MYLSRNGFKSMSLIALKYTTALAITNALRPTDDSQEDSSR